MIKMQMRDVFKLSLCEIPTAEHEEIILYQAEKQSNSKDVVNSYRSQNAKQFKKSKKHNKIAKLSRKRNRKVR